MEKGPCRIVQHVISRMSISDSHNVCCDTLSRQRLQKDVVVLFKGTPHFFHVLGLAKLVQLFVLPQEVIDNALFSPRAHQLILVFVH